MSRLIISVFFTLVMGNLAILVDEKYQLSTSANYLFGFIVGTVMTIIILFPL